MKLKEWREDVGRSAADVAEELGCTRQAVQKYEAGRLPNAITLEAIVTMTGGLVTPNDWLDFHTLAPAVVGRPPETGYAIEWKPRLIMRNLHLSSA